MVAGRERLVGSAGRRARGIRAFCDRYDVEFALLPADANQVLSPLLATDEFQRRTEIPGYVLLERRVPGEPKPHR